MMNIIMSVGITSFTKLWIALVAEHLIFLIKFLIQKLIPDAPSWVKEAYAKKTYMKQISDHQKHLEARKVH